MVLLLLLVKRFVYYINESAFGTETIRPYGYHLNFQTIMMNQLLLFLVNSIHL